MEYENLVKRLSPKLRAISRKVKGKYTYCDEDDFYQEALVHLWVLFERGELSDKMDSYILQGCFYFLKNYIRKLLKAVDERSVSLETPVDDGECTIADTLSSGSYSGAADSIGIYFFMDGSEKLFNQREKDIFYYQLEGFTTREIGEMIGVSHVMVVKTANNLRQKCQALKEELF